MSFSCTRTLTRQSCTTDPNLNAHSYFYNMSLVKVSECVWVFTFNYCLVRIPEQRASCLSFISSQIPVVEMSQVSGFLVGFWANSLNSLNSQLILSRNSFLDSSLEIVSLLEKKIPVSLFYTLFQINVTPQSDWPVPSEHNTSCLNVVKNVSACSFSLLITVFLPLKNECVQSFYSPLFCFPYRWSLSLDTRVEGNSHMQM